MEDIWIIRSGVSAVNDVFQVTTFDVSEFMGRKVTEMQSFSDVTIKMYFHWSVSTLKNTLPHLTNYGDTFFDEKK